MTPEALTEILEMYAQMLIAQGVTDPKEIAKRLEEKVFLVQREVTLATRKAADDLAIRENNRPVLFD